MMTTNHTNTNQPKQIAVAGAGITGLSTAFYIRKAAAEQGVPVEITLIESSDQLGGKIRTLHRDGCVIEQGPDSFLARKLPMIELARELGIESELVAVNPKAKTYIIHEGKLHRMPQGLMLGIPTEVMPFVRTGLIGPLGKARAAMDILLPRKKTTEDEALGAFLRRRLGSDVLEQIAEPLLAGIYAGDTDVLSLQATFPQFKQLEQKHRSLILGMIYSKKQQRSASGTAGLPPVAKGAMFLTFKNGLVTLIDALSESLQEMRFITGQAVTQVSQTIDQSTRVRLQDGTEQVFDAVVVTVPNFAASNIVTEALGSASQLIHIPYASVANVVMAFRKSEVENKMNAGSGFVVPRRAGLLITACTWTSVKWPHAAPEDIALVRCYVGRQGDERGFKLTNEELVLRVRADLNTTMGITAEPIFVEPTRWNQAMPQYPVGHLSNVEAFREQLKAKLPGVFVTGSGFHGVGLPDCIAQGKQAAQQAMDYVTRS